MKDTNISKPEKVSAETMKVIYDEFKGLIKKYSVDKKAKKEAQKDFDAIVSVICILSVRDLLKY